MRRRWRVGTSSYMGATFWWRRWWGNRPSGTSCSRGGRWRSSCRSVLRGNFHFRRLDAWLERPYIVLAGNLAKSYSMGLGVFQCACVIPMVKIDLVGPDHGSGAVGAALAVHEYRTRCRILQQSQNFG